MAALHFEETQRVRESAWAWVGVIAIFLMALLPLLYGMYWQLGQGEPWGNEPISDQNLVLSFVIILVCCVGGAAAFLSLTLEVKIDNRGVHYRCVPHVWKWRSISKEEISEYVVEKKMKWFHAVRLGYQRNRLRNTRSARIHGQQQVVLRLKNGQVVMLGTRNAEGVERAMRKLINDTETI